MSFGRSYHNMTMLPDGTVLVSGGGSTLTEHNLANSVLPAEIWNPDTETWTTVDSLVKMVVCTTRRLCCFPTGVS